MPTRTRVSKHARLLIKRSSSHSRASFSKSRTTVDPPRVTDQKGFHASCLERTESEVSKFLPSRNIFAFLHCRQDTTDHHGADTDSHDSPKCRAVDWNNFARVFTVDVQPCTDCLRLHQL